MPSMLAHGALGPYDEIIFLGIAAAFLGMMGVSWLRSQQVDDEFEDDLREADSERFELE